MSYNWLTLIISLPGRKAAPRVRIWRSLKACGVGILRDGVYLLPSNDENRLLFDGHVEEISDLNGSAYVLEHSSDGHQTEQFICLFDRVAEYQAWNELATLFKNQLRSMDEAKARKEEIQLRRKLDLIIDTDFFPNSNQSNALEAMRDISASVNAFFSPDEPNSTEAEINILSRSGYKNRLWATRENLWVDRVASAWLIKRHIDTKAKFLWLKKPGDCPPIALGFDFDGATFSHAGHRVTFEVLLASFTLDTDDALVKMGDLIHYLDVGGVSVGEAQGFLTLLAGTKQQTNSDDEFNQRAFVLFDTLYTAFQNSTGEK